ncbi:helix-turn-helix transcriptional regulator [Paraburkholderia phosphatilytica]|uniref:helix-turn-helix transcriptional regulator n=1 Tax=Paraburkholderia phosphatilytica TaxID=2282883 RepID=UPI0013DFF0A7|nr:transcriptional regulator [Paraburkholderia phosphatilytica]
MPKTTEKADAGQTSTPVLPQIGLSKWAQIAPYVGIGRESWRKLSIAGKAPRAIRMSATCALYENREIHRWLADPVGYTVALAEQPEAA